MEIGVSNPYTNFLSISCNRKASVDPCIECEFFSRDAIENFKPFITHQMTSDEFFEQNHEMFDIIFIDGDHSYEQSLKDLNNALKVIPVGGFIILHDTTPIDFEATQITNFEKKLFYNGEVWKTVFAAKKFAPNHLQIGTVPHDFGVTVIKKLTANVPEIPMDDFDYYRDYNVPALNPIFDVREFHNKKVSFFTPLYNTPQQSIERTARTVLNQTNPSWEWVLYDDSNNDADAKRLEKFFESLNDKRIKYFKFNKRSGGVIGLAKKYATSLCTGDYLAELDHDDLVMPDIVEQILTHGEGFDFIYSNCASVIINEDETFTQGEHFGDIPGFAMGYGEYRSTVAINPLNGDQHDYQECICVPINPKTIRHIVGVPNHIRVWDKKFYDSIDGHNTDLRVVDDYELVVRSFLANGKFLHLDRLGYLQVFTGDNTTDKRRDEIQILVDSVLAKYDEQIRDEFVARNLEDWAYNWHLEKFGFCANCNYFGFNSVYHYCDVPSMVGADPVNCKI